MDSISGYSSQPLQLGGIFSGIDTSSIVDRLVSIQSYPITLLQKKEADITATLTTYQDLNSKVLGIQSKLSSLLSNDTFTRRTTAVSDPEVMTAAATNSAATGIHRFIVKSLGKASSITSLSPLAFLNTSSPLSSARFANPFTGIDRIRTALSYSLQGSPSAINVRSFDRSAAVAGLYDIDVTSLAKATRLGSTLPPGSITYGLDPDAALSQAGYAKALAGLTGSTQTTESLTGGTSGVFNARLAGFAATPGIYGVNVSSLATATALSSATLVGSWGLNLSNPLPLAGYITPITGLVPRTTSTASITSANPAIAGATLQGTAATPGDYSVVVSSLASATRLASGALYGSTPLDTGAALPSAGLATAITGLQTRTYIGESITSSNNAALTASIQGNAATPGTYDVTVQTVATRTTLDSGAIVSTAAINPSTAITTAGYGTPISGLEARQGVANTNNSVATVSIAGATATPGTYNLTVNSLATATSVTSATPVSNLDPTAPIGLQGYLTPLTGSNKTVNMSFATNTNDSVATFEVSSSAGAGTHTVQVTQIATATTLASSGSADRTGKLVTDARYDRASFAAGPSSGGGTFVLSVNGQNKNISYSASDTLQDVLDQVSSTTNGRVSATYIAAQDKIVFSATSGNTFSIVGDSSGNFLDAAKIQDGASGSFGSPVSSTGTLALPADTIDSNALLTTQGANTYSQIGSGTFQVNGVSISLTTSDTLNAVIDKINLSDANVTASFDGVTGKLTLTQNTTGNNQDIVVSNDNTGFLHAFRLDTASQATGQDAIYRVDGANKTSHLNDENTNIGGVYMYLKGPGTTTLTVTKQSSTATGGAFKVNGQSVTWNTSMSMNQIMADINVLGNRDAVASFDTQTNAISLTASGRREAITAEDTSGNFLAASNLLPGTVTYTPDEREIRTSSSPVVSSTVDPDALLTGLTDGFTLPIYSGSFTINGASIALTNADTLNTLMAKIDASAAGVTASFDADAQAVTLTSTGTGSTAIAFGADTTGFLAAARLTGTPQDLGLDASFSVNGTSYTSQSNTGVTNVNAELQGVTLDLVAPGSTSFTVSQWQGGTLTVNGTGIDYRETDSLNTIIGAINGSGAGVTASYSGTQDRLTLTSTVQGQGVAVGDTVGNLAAASNLPANVPGIPGGYATLTSSARVGGAYNPTPTDDLFSYFDLNDGGQYTINGHAFTLDSGATLQSVIDGINGAGIGVAASYDSGAKTLHLENIATGGTSILLGADTSRLFTALGLNQGNQSLGEDSAFTVNGTAYTSPKKTGINNINPDLAGVTVNLVAPGSSTLTIDQSEVTRNEGTVTINGESIVYDDSQSLDTIISNINGSDAGVLAEYDPLRDTLKLTSTVAGQGIAVSDTEANLLAATRLSTGIAGTDAQGFATLTSDDRIGVHVTLDPDAALSSYYPDLASGGSFVINGHSFSYQEGDTLNNLIGDINAANIAVDASFDGGTGQMALTSRATGNVTITLGADSAGIFDAFGLDQESQATGSQARFTINGTAYTKNSNTGITGLGAALTGVTLNLSATGATTLTVTRNSVTKNEGAFQVNGVSITYDDSQNVQGIISAINASAANATASYDQQADKMVLTSKIAGQDVTVSDTTGNLMAANLLTTGVQGYDSLGYPTLTSSGKISNLYSTDPAKPLSDYYSGLVPGGVFTVNGTQLTYMAGESLNDIMDLINNSSAGLTASFDASANALRLTQKTTGASTITLGLDTANLFSSLGLSQINQIQGHNNSFTINGTSYSRPGNTGLTDLGQGLTGVTVDLLSTGSDSFMINRTITTTHSGAFTLNGYTFNYDDRDTLNDILGRLNQTEGLGVTASWNALDDKVELTSTVAGQAITASDVTGNFLAVNNLVPGAVGASGSFPTLSSSSHVSTTGTTFGDIDVNALLTGNSTGFIKPITTGSFAINGVDIAVEATDTLSSLMTKINGSDAGVNAAWDAGSHTFSLTGKTIGASAITLGADSSGFLDAANLLDAEEETGSQAVFSVNGASFTRDENTGIDDVIAGVTFDLTAAGSNTLDVSPQDYTVEGGSFKINDTTIDYYLDDTLNELIARINGAGANVTASYDTVKDRFTLTSTNGDPLTVTNVDGNFLAATKLANATLGSNGSEYTLTSTGSLASRINPTGYLIAGSSNLPGAIKAGTFKVNGYTINVAASDTLSSIINKINSSGTNAIASFDQASQKFTIRNKTFGTAGVALTDDTSGFLAAVKLAGAESSAGNQLNVEMDGEDYFFTSNTAADLLEGVTLNFLEESAQTDGDWKTTTLTIGRDTAISKQAITEFVESYNTFIDFYQANTAGPQYQGTKLTKAAGSLISDNNLKWMVYSLKRDLTKSFEDLPTGMNDLSDIGITLGRYGSGQDMSKLYLDETKLDAALAEDPEGDTDLFTKAKTGFSDTLERTVGSFTNDTYGAIPSMMSFYNQQIADLQTRMDKYSTYLQSFRNGLVNQFMQMETMMARIQSQGTSLSTTLNQILNATTGNN